jgi:hypothetical protein
MEPAALEFVNANGDSYSARGVIRDATVTLGDLRIRLDLYVTKGGMYDLLLGSDFLAPIGAQIDYDRRELRFQLGPGWIGVVRVNFQGWGHDCCMMATAEAEEGNFSPY